MKHIAIVTGASSGIGKEFFLSLKENANALDEIWVIARSEEKLKALQAETPVRIFALDLSQSSSITALERALNEEKPSVEYLICASGFGRFRLPYQERNRLYHIKHGLRRRAVQLYSGRCFGTARGNYRSQEEKSVARGNRLRCRSGDNGAFWLCVELFPHLSALRQDDTSDGSHHRRLSEN